MFDGLRTYLEPLLSVIGNTFVALLFAVAFATFIFNVVRYFILPSDESDARSKARQYAVYAIVGFVLILTLWSLIGIISALFGVDSSTGITIPSAIQ